MQCLSGLKNILLPPDNRVTPQPKKKENASLINADNALPDYAMFIPLQARSVSKLETQIKKDQDHLSTVRNFVHAQKISSRKDYKGISEITLNHTSQTYYFKTVVDWVKTIYSLLPKNFLQIQCQFKNIKVLPHLPFQLVYLNCAHNELTYLPQLPNTLQYLICSHNYLIKLPKFPSSLVHVDCSYNFLVSLADLPQDISFIYCNNNYIGDLSHVPDKVSILDICDNNLLTLPETRARFSCFLCSENHISCIVNINWKISGFFIRQKSLPQYNHPPCLQLQAQRVIIQAIPHAQDIKKLPLPMRLQTLLQSIEKHK